MANNCWNNIIISDIDKESREKIITWLETYRQFNYMNDWVNSLISKENQLDYYGGKWFEAGVESNDDDFMQISGDSAWAPMTGLCQAISNEFECNITLNFEESGNDIGGEVEYHAGAEDIKYDGTYDGYNYWCEGIHRLIEMNEDLYNIETYIDKLNGIRKYVKPEDVNVFREAFPKLDKQYQDKIKLKKYLAKI